MKKSVIVAVALFVAGASQVKAQCVSFGVSFGCPPPMYVAPQPVVFVPPPVYVAPTLVVVVPPPVWVAGPPVVFAPRPVMYGWGPVYHPRRSFHHR
jgi:hypothetical protein